MVDLQAHLRVRVLTALGDVPADAVVLQPPKDRKHGDVALACFLLAKARGQSPAAVATELAQSFAPDAVVAQATAAGPFVNFHYARGALAEVAVGSILADRAPYGVAPATGKQIVIDFSSPNIAKPFHMGHLRSTMIGMALCRIHRHCGNTVHGINHLGDWGAQFGKMLTAFERWGNDAELARDPMGHMFAVYSRYAKAAKEDPSLDARSAEHFQALESGADNHERALWQRLRAESLRAFAGPYARLGVTFDHYTGESFYEDKMPAAIERVRQAGILTHSEGAEVVDLSDAGMPPCILRKTDGTTIYATRDLAAIFYRAATFQFDRALYVVGAEQALHFKQLKAVLAKMQLPVAERIEHVPFGLILGHNSDSGKWEKFATRHGNAIFLDEVLDEAVARAAAIIAEKNPELADRAAVAEKVGVSAIVFNDLKNARIKDVKFDLAAMTNFDGETGPYVQYAAARLSSILSKAELPVDWAPTGPIAWTELADAEDVLLTMLEFGPALQRAAEQSEPSVITDFVLRLAGAIHAYLKDHHVLRAAGAQREARLALVAAGRRLLRTGMGLIGVAALDEM